MIIDTHAHLDSPEFEADLPEVLRQAESVGVKKVICPGTTAQSSRRVIELASSFEQILPAVGIHPNYAGEACPGDWRLVEELADLPQVVAVGETGLDRHWDFTPWGVQEDYFDRHLWLAGKKGLPVIVHCREAEEDVLRHLRLAHARQPLTGVLHAYSSPPEFAGELLALGFYVSFAGSVTYRNKKFEPLREAARTIPRDRILVETDSPYLVPEPHRGKLKRNCPALIRETVLFLASILQTEYDYLCQITSENASRLFRLTI